MTNHDTVRRARALAAALAALLSVAFCITAAKAAESGGFEKPPVLKAAQVLPAYLLKGPAFAVQDRVANDGLVNTYQVESGFGSFQARSTLALAKLAGELEAVRAMAKVESGETFAKGLEAGAKNTAKGVKRLFSDPKGAVEGAATGLGRLFDRAGEAVSGPGPGTGEDSRTQQFIGFSKSKRELAAKYDVDAYSDNKVLQEELDRLAWADYGGGISLGAATMVVPGAAGFAISTSGGVRILNDVMRTKPPSELRLINRDKLSKVGVSPDLIDLFLTGSVYSPREQTVIVAALENMSGVKQRSLAVKTALMAQDRPTAFILTNMIAMYALYHQKTAPLAELVPVGRVFYARAKDGAAAVLLPTDYIIWSPRLAGLAKKIAATGAKSLLLRVTGTLSPLARKNLEAAGWRIQDHAEKDFLVKPKGR